MNGICENIRTGGHAISFGWNSNGFGKRRGFEIVEIMLVAHGTHHNDTIVTVEKKVQSSLPWEEIMKILNLYAGLGGNRRLWDGKKTRHITAVET